MTCGYKIRVCCLNSYKFYNRLEVPWVKLIWSIHYENTVPHASEPCGSFWWRDVMQLSPIYRVTKVAVGDGSTVLFWKDQWQQEILAESHPRLFSFVRDEDVSVQKLLTAQTLGQNFQNFHLPLSIQAREELSDLQAVTASTELSIGANDVWSCTWGSTKFESSKFYHHCFQDMQVDEAFKNDLESKMHKQMESVRLVIASRQAQHMQHVA